MNAVRRLAARVAVTASRKTGRPVDPRVAQLAADDDFLRAYQSEKARSPGGATRRQE
ncbi:hypothetical protein SEA_THREERNGTARJAY_178 [Mycobacterium phage ThreeRngTarjay]|nr:hypothetical protein SEA_HALLEY_181 [Mycobacterium phage Halley]QBI97685.1 hypothetical protein SEA_HUGHESYANG_179 [Mycobacterium phage Hughesyang]QBI99879.1 hypothetical protein SEA_THREERNGTARJAY_178 [Mycobacterium phage ThreeRngTarjay]QBJ00189.1 hypothetical protein SEA_PHOEBUS_181 [Mycobacterium phage Phoebus]QCO93864.1 hypothetical protein SEA_SCHATZIE_175 [Mycobacterium phage Schatzie]QDM57997.1 hypothetical protein SEA_NIHILNOMEN_182 [Mycobacterium phage NihilNomen]QDP43925.1 hypoth